MKYFKSILITLTILLSLSTFASATTYKCPGEMANITWSSANIQGSTCYFGKTDPSFEARSGSITPENANTAATGAGFIVQTGGTITLSCSGHAAVTDTLTILQGASCASIIGGTDETQQCNRSGWRGQTCISVFNSNNCLISEGQGSCTNTIKWSTVSGAVSNAQVVNNTTGEIISTAATGNISYATPYGGVQIRLNNNGVNLGSVTLGATCAAGLAWDTDSNTCEKSDASIAGC